MKLIIKKKRDAMWFALILLSIILLISMPILEFKDYKSKKVIIKENDKGEIVEVWKLENTFTTETDSTITFKTKDDIKVTLGVSNLKILKDLSQEEFDKYEEIHPNE